MTIRLLPLAAILLVSIPHATAQEAAWLQNFADAKAKARQDKKDLLIDFTGSDWCVWCKRLDQEVFDEAEFQSAIVKDFVLVKLDFPQDDSHLTDEIKAQNAVLQKDYGVQGFPTIFLTDADGRPYAQTGYQRGGAANYLKHVAELQQARKSRDEHLAKANDAKGAERALHLAAALDAVGEELAGRHYLAEMKEVIALDSDNKAGLKERFEAILDRAEQQGVLAQIEQQLNELAQKGEWDAVGAAMDKALATYKGKKAIEQMATFYKAIAVIEGKQDLDKGLDLIDQAMAIDPASQMGKRLEMIKKNVEKMKQDKGGG